MHMRLTPEALDGSFDTHIHFFVIHRTHLSLRDHFLSVRDFAGTGGAEAIPSAGMFHGNARIECNLQDSFSVGSFHNFRLAILEDEGDFGHEGNTILECHGRLFNLLFERRSITDIHRLQRRTTTMVRMSSVETEKSLCNGMQCPRCTAMSVSCVPLCMDLFPGIENRLLDSYSKLPFHSLDSKWGRRTTNGQMLLLYNKKFISAQSSHTFCKMCTHSHYILTMKKEWLSEHLDLLLQTLKIGPENGGANARCGEVEFIPRRTETITKSMNECLNVDSPFYRI